jgi:hypothetical protein
MSRPRRAGPLYQWFEMIRRLARCRSPVMGPLVAAPDQALADGPVHLGSEHSLTRVGYSFGRCLEW